MNNYILVGVMTLLLAGCGGNRLSRLAIEDGEAVSDVERKSLGLVGLRADLDPDELSGYCTGTVIAKDLILTAAHCLNTPKGPVSFAFPETDIAASPKRDAVPIVAYYRPSSQDIVILRTSGHLNADVQTLAAAQDYRTGKALWAYGFGRRQAEDPSSGGLLQKKAIRSGFLSHFSPIITGFPVTAGGPCFGDSGGPLFVEDQSGGLKIVGVLSNGNANCRGGDTWANPHPVLELIDQAIAGEVEFDQLSIQ